MVFVNNPNSGSFMSLSFYESAIDNNIPIRYSLTKNLKRSDIRVGQTLFTHTLLPPVGRILQVLIFENQEKSMNTLKIRFI